MASVDEHQEGIGEAVRLVRSGNLEGLAELYMRSPGILRGYQQLMCWAEEGCHKHITTWLKAIKSAP